MDKKEIDDQTRRMLNSTEEMRMLDAISNEQYRELQTSIKAWAYDRLRKV